ncbi:MAG: hypothetical protein IJZ29_03800 [Clostridia bacterium]|nr:hypothetical protein [Clostridia bacterium]
MKGTKRQNLALAIMVAMLLIFSMSAGISFAYFSATKTSADQTLKFGKLVVTVNDGASDIISITSDAEMSDTSVIALSGTLGLEESSSNAFIRIMPNVAMEYSNGTAVDTTAVSAFKTLLLTGLADADSTGIMQKVGKYVYYAGDFTENTAYNFASKSINLASYAFNDAWQGATVTISFTIQAIQSTGLGLDLSSYSTYADKATAISNLSAWDTFGITVYEDGLAYTLSDDGTYYSVRAKDSSVTGDVVILNEIDGIPVTTLEEDAFENCSGITSIHIPSNVNAPEYNVYSKDGLEIYIDSEDFISFNNSVGIESCGVNMDNAFGESPWTVYLHTSIIPGDLMSGSSYSHSYIGLVGDYHKIEVTKN